MKIVIIGGGPIGVEAALYGASAGFDVQLFERGELCENVRAWRHIGLFTEWRRNSSPLAARLLTENGVVLPDENTSPDGEELAAYVAQIADLEVLRGRIFAQMEVVAITRERTLKSDLYQDACRAQRPFRLLVRDENGERIEHAEVVIDVTGVYATPNLLGNGGMPCVGERELAARIDYHLPDVTGRDRARFANRHTLVVGSGHSAASTLRSVAELFDTSSTRSATRITWVVRRDVPPHGFPYALEANDHAPQRNALHQRANELSRAANVVFRARTVVEKVESKNARFVVTLSTRNGEDIEYSIVECDNIACHTGFRADASLWSELQIALHPATGGPFGLGATIVDENARAGVGFSTGYAEKAPTSSTRSDDLTTEKAPQNDARTDASLLRLGEPNFYILGIKSYGRDAGFLMQNGFRQVRDVFKIIAQSDLDLYEGKI